MDPSFQEFRILAVDDSPIYRKLVEQTLSQQRYTLLLAKNGREALALFAKHQPAVVITDWTMPDIEGLELCRRIRSDFPGVYSHLILLTSNTDKEQVVEGLAAGADDYLTKPFHTGELLARVAVGRRIAELHRQIQATNRSLEELALTDSLTGLPNRRALDIWATHELSAAERHGFSLWVVIADLDHFKSINDTHGHEAGDTVLKSFAEILKANTRKSNMCCRLGGEEFLIVMTHVEEKANAILTIDRIRERFRAQKFTVAGKMFGVTASFGVAGFRGPNVCDWNSLVAHADTALYAAKNKGRDRIEFAS